MVVCLAYLLLTNLAYMALIGVAFVENVVRRHEHAQPGLRRARRVALHDPGQRDRCRVQRGDRHRVDRRVAARARLSGVRGHRGQRRIGRRNARPADRGVRARAVQVFVRHVFPTEAVRAIYRSAAHPNLVVVDKENGGKSDALNAGLNVARFRYVCGVDADTVFDREALLKGMRRVVEDPARIIGVTSHLTIAAGPGAGDGGATRPTTDRPEAVHGVPAPGLSPRLLQQPPRLVAARLHALRRRRLPDLAS